MVCVREACRLPTRIRATCFFSQYMRTSRQADYVLLQARLNHSSRPPPPVQTSPKSSPPTTPASNYVHGGGEGADAGSALQATTGGRAEHGVVWLGRLLLAVVLLCGDGSVSAHHGGEWGGWQTRGGHASHPFSGYLAYYTAHYTTPRQQSHARANNDKDAAETGAFPSLNRIQKRCCVRGRGHAGRGASHFHPPSAPRQYFWASPSLVLLLILVL